jgi:glycosyltransferase involved in cell wall biosynthesis
MRASIPSAEYWIIGTGPDRRSLERLTRRLGCADAVRFLGFIPRHQVLTTLEQIDVLVHPSIHEQIGYVVLEAMAAGRPVVCLRSAGPSLLVGDAGLVVDVDEPGRVVEGLAAALHELATDPARRLALGTAARERARSQWTWDVIGERLRGIYDEAAARVNSQGS